MAQVEILLAAYNGEAYVRAQLESILAQTDARWHLTVSDDGSTDGTAAILDEYAAKYPDRIARYCSGRRFGGARGHFLHLMSRCDAPYMLFCDQDDVWLPEKVGAMIEALLRAESGDPDVPALVFSDLTPVDEDMRPIAASMMAYQNQRTDGLDYRSLLMQNVVTGGAMGCNRALARLAGDVAGETDILMHDGWLAALAARFGRVAYIPKPLHLYRQHGNNSVGAQNVRSAGYVLGRLASVRGVRETILGKKRQAALFARLYDDRLGPDDAAFLNGFTKSRSGPWFYWRNRRFIHGFWRMAGMMILG